MRKLQAVLVTLLMLFNLVPLSALAAGSPGDVVINELAWAGSIDSSGDEWIELYNNTGSDVDLTGWKLVDDGSSEYVLAGIVPANSYFLIEDAEDVTSVVADQVVSISLANSGDSLQLVDETGAVIDTVNSTGGAWFAGNSSSALTMERIDPNGDGDDPANWADNTAGSGATASAGSLIAGTPQSTNSVTVVPTVVDLQLSDSSPSQSDQVTLTVNAVGVNDLFSYGVELSYDPAVLAFVGAGESTFLSEDGTVSTSFQAGLEDDQEGTLLVAEARLVDSAVGVSGDGQLFTATFDVIGASGTSTDITVAPASFLADPNDDLIATFADTQLSIPLAVVDPVTDLTIAEAVNRYQLQLAWQAPATGADSYQIFKKDQFGSFFEIADVTALQFSDSSDLVPNLTYEYQVVAVKAGEQSVAVLTSGQDSRGLTGDNDRSDRVDGRDLQRLANHFAELVADTEFDQKIDTNYDGIIDGADLLDITANFALTY